MPDNEGQETPQPKPFWKHRGLQFAAAGGLLALIVLLYQVCGVDPPREFGVVNSEGDIVEEESPEDSDDAEADEEEADETEPTPTGPKLGFSVSSGLYHLTFSGGKGNCGFTERFEDDFRIHIRGELAIITQLRTEQKTEGRFDEDTGEFETRGRSGGHVEIYQGRFTDRMTFRGNYSIFQDCDQHWKLRDEMRR
jgi:hypothetical protein